MQERSFPQPDQAELPSYRSISASAVVALILGVLSVAALAYPAAWLLPAVAVAVALFALLRIRRNAEVLMGRKAAVAGLLLALLFGSWAPAKFFAGRWMLSRQARQFAVAWCQLVLQGEQEQAHQATLDHYDRQPAGTLLKDFYQSNEQARQQLQDFFSQGAADRLTRFSPQAHVAFLGTREQYCEGRECVVVQEYHIADPPPSLRPPLDLQLSLLRVETSSAIYWNVMRVGEVDSHTHEH